ncbi:MAG: NADH-quinone oxidoreductase subunit NuoE [Hyphomicrobiaceae bacterium]|nr:NADH-quinone oxidoreductase subunit NuoE [Hyphomicrobiaceae bacterium]
MAVRRLHPEQPPSFAFTSENLAWVQETVAKYPPGKQASAVIPVLWRAQEQNDSWLSEPAIRVTADLLGMAYIRVYEIATFYTMFQLAPVGLKAHIQVCGTTPCMLRGSEELIAVCKTHIAPHAHERSADGNFSWEEVECLGSCANAPMVQIFKDTYEDLTPTSFEKLIEGFASGKPPKPGSQTGRQVSAPAGKPSTLTDPSLYDGSTVGAWRKRFEQMANQPSPIVPPPAAAPAAPAPPPPAAPPAAAPAKPAVHPAALAAMANAGLIKELQDRGGDKPLSPDQMSAIKARMAATGPMAATAGSDRPETLSAPRGGKADDLKLIWGIGPKLEKGLNRIGFYHFDQIAGLSAAQLQWVESQLDDKFGSAERDKWVEQAAKLATGWQPKSQAGDRPNVDGPNPGEPVAGGPKPGKG